MLRAEGRSWDVARHRRVEVRSEERARRGYSCFSLIFVVQMSLDYVQYDCKPS
jgi:hypothetical protein